MSFRMSREDRISYGVMLSERHKKMWGECPAVDLDFLLNEYNYGEPVAVVEYKHHKADLNRPHENNLIAVSNLYNRHGEQLPLFIARFWPETWAFRVKPWNESAQLWMSSRGHDAAVWSDMTEQEYVGLLMLLRRDSLTAGDLRTLARLNADRPPSDISTMRSAS